MQEIQLRVTIELDARRGAHALCRGGWSDRAKVGPIAARGEVAHVFAVWEGLGADRQERGGERRGEEG